MLETAVLIPIDSEWWAFHHSDDTDRQVLMISVYLDESATNKGKSPIAVVGGVVLNYGQYAALKEEWTAMLAEFSEVAPALHMKDFGEHGRLGSMIPARRSQVFSRASEIIRRTRAITLSATLEHEAYMEIFSRWTRYHHSQYELCFIMVALTMAHVRFVGSEDSPTVAFVMDQGNEFAEQVRLAHKELRTVASKMPEFSRFRIGGLTFDDDQIITALQAADVVCWAERRRASGARFLEGTEPLLDIFLDDTKHACVPMERRAMEALEKEFQSRTIGP